MRPPQAPFSEGLLTDLIAAGAIVSEPSCGSCAGIGHVPAAGAKVVALFGPEHGYTGDQGFFIAYAQSWTANTRPETLKQMLTLPHKHLLTGIRARIKEIKKSTPDIPENASSLGAIDLGELA